VRALIWGLAVLAAVVVVDQIAIRLLVPARVERDLAGTLEVEIEEWQRFVAATDPNGPASEDDLARRLADYLELRAPRDGQVLIGVVDGRIAAAEPMTAARQLVGSDEIAAWSGIDGRRSGTIERTDLEYRWTAVDIGPLGTFVAAADLTTEQAEANDAIEVVTLVAIVGWVLAALLAVATIGRMLSPLRRTSEVARTINERQLPERVPVTSDDELGELSRTFNAMLDRLDAAFAARRDFIDDLGHELRTPLTIVRGHLDVFPDDPAEQQETLDLCRDELDRMGRDVECLALVAKSRQPAFLARRSVDLAELLDESIQRARLLHREHLITVDRIAEGTAWCDPDRIYQALENFIANACKYSPPGTRVTVGSLRSGGFVHFFVADQGPGIDAADQHRIFERFARGYGPAARREGTGLGLAIVRAVAEAHGGQVGVDSRPAAGATFWFTVADVAVPGGQPRTVARWGLPNELEASGA